ncbi:MAG: hypothetical protein IKC08_08780 [Lentisphaeria bacterium]|nr:hypothetical protein [Lentisphaeria bacterium]
MRFIFAIYRFFPYGGLQKDFLRMAREVIRRGHSLTVLAAEWEGEKPSGAELVMLNAAGLTNHAKMASFGKNVRKYVKELREKNAPTGER